MTTDLDALTPSARALRERASRLHATVAKELAHGNSLSVGELNEIEQLLRQLMEGQWVNAETLGSIAEISSKLNTNRTTVTNWQARRSSLVPNFPHPVAENRNGPVYVLPDVVAWWNSWTPAGKSAKSGHVNETETN